MRKAVNDGGAVVGKAADADSLALTDKSKNDSNDALVVFMPSGKRGRFPLSTPILNAARSLGVDIDSVCGGRAICGRCQIEVTEGEFAKHGISSSNASITAAGEAEQRFDTRRGIAAGRRLSCQALLQNDVVIAPSRADQDAAHDQRL